MPIKIHFSRLLGEKKVRANAVSKATGITGHALSAMYKETLKGIRFDSLEKLCEFFNCTVSDILEYIPKTKKANKTRYK